MKFFFPVILFFATASLGFAFPPSSDTIQIEQRIAAARGLSFALENVPDDHVVLWRHRYSRAGGMVMPLKTYRTSYGQVCREYKYRLAAPGGGQLGFGTACRQNGGGWLVAGQQAYPGQAQAERFDGTQMRRCPYFSHWHPPVDGVTQPRREQRYHREEFLRKQRRLPQPGQQRLPPGIQLVAN